MREAKASDSVGPGWLAVTLPTLKKLREAEFISCPQ
jgi:hypothetical protein